MEIREPMDAKEIAEKISRYTLREHDNGESRALAVDYLHLRAENEALKAPKPTLESIGMTAIGIEMAAGFQAIIVALGCQVAGVNGALKVIEAKNAVLEESERQNAAMREMVTTTDHSKECALYRSWRIGTTCNCWKSGVLAALQATPEPKP